MDTMGLGTKKLKVKTFGRSGLTQKIGQFFSPRSTSPRSNSPQQVSANESDSNSDHDAIVESQTDTNTITSRKVNNVAPRAKTESPDIQTPKKNFLGGPITMLPQEMPTLITMGPAT